VSLPLSQRPTTELMRIVHKRAKNTRALAKVVSAYHYLSESHSGIVDSPNYFVLDFDDKAVWDAARVLESARFDLIRARRILGVDLLVERDRQAKGQR
jgi:hypothetical protein